MNPASAISNNFAEFFAESFAEVFSPLQQAATGSQPKNLIETEKNTFTHSDILDRASGVSFTDVLDIALPKSNDVKEFKSLVLDIAVNRNTDIYFDEAKVGKSTNLLNKIITENWNYLPLNFKVVLLAKLYPLRHGLVDVLFSIVTKTFVKSLKKSLKKTQVYFDSDRETQKKIQRIYSPELLTDYYQIFTGFLKSCKNLFKADGYLLEENIIKLPDYIQEIKHEIDDKKLCWDEKAYFYLKEQERIFEECRPILIENYRGKYVFFEDGKVIDFDDDEDTLLERILEKDLSLGKPGIFYGLIS